MSDVPATPRLAATVLLLRDRMGVMEVFMVTRSHAIDFASGALVFPGGRVDPEDHALAADPALCPPIPGVDAHGMAVRVAAIRETFEEVGVLLARPTGCPVMYGGETQAAIAERHRAAVHKSERTMAEVAAAEGFQLACDALVPFAHWITPETMAKRFDTHFFAVAMPWGQKGLHDGHESIDSVWIAPQAARDGVAEGRFRMVFATDLNLAKLARQTTTQAALEAAAATPIITILPQPERLPDGRRRLRIPLEAGYGGDVFDVELPGAMAETVKPPA